MLSYNETKELIQYVLNTNETDFRITLFFRLSTVGSNEGEFYQSIARHAPFMKLTSDQWLDLLSKLPNQIFWSQIDIEQVLSEEQKRKLPPVTG